MTIRQLSADSNATLIVSEAGSGVYTNINWTAGTPLSQFVDINRIGGSQAPATPVEDPEQVTTPVSRLADDLAAALGSVVQADGKVIVVSLLSDDRNFEGDYNETHQNPEFDRIALTRFNADGTIDTTFGTDGSLTYTLVKNATDGAGNNGAVIADSQGRILVGYSYGILRFNADGSFDQSFGENGYIEGDYPWAMREQADGKILVLSNTNIIRLNEDGSADASFTPYELKVVGSKWGVAYLTDIAIAADGSLFVTGAIRTDKEGPDVAMTTAYLTKLHADGTVDTTFANNGRYEFGQAGRKWEHFNAISILPDGKLLVAGTYSKVAPFPSPTTPGALEWNKTATLLARFNADGSLDSTFGTGGFVRDEALFINDVFGMLVLDDGRIVLSTYGENSAKLVVANADGSDLHFVEQQVDLPAQQDPTADYSGRYETYTRAPMLAPDGTIVTGVAVLNLNAPSCRKVANTYWARFDLDAGTSTAIGMTPVDDAEEAVGPENAEAEAEVSTPTADESETAPVEPVSAPTAESAPALADQPQFALTNASGFSSVAIDRAFTDLFKDERDDMFGVADVLST